MSGKPVHLEINDAGGWRRVLSFDCNNEAHSEAVLHAVPELLACSSNQRIKARIIYPGDTAPLMHWEATTGWREWRKLGDAV